MTLPLQDVDTSSADADVPVNENFETVGAAGLFGKRQPATTGLTWAFYGGRYLGNDVANGTVTLTNAATNYIVVERSSGTVSVSTSTTNWNNADDYARIYTAVTSGGSVSSEVDCRVDTGGVFAGGGATGGGSSGALVYQGLIDCTSNPNYPAATEGDLYIVSDGGKIGGGSGTDVLAGDFIICTADNAGGTEAGVGASWDVISNLPYTVGGPLFRATVGSNQSISDDTWTKIQVNTEDFDTDSVYDSATNYRFTPGIAGYYHFDGSLRFNGSGTLTEARVGIYKNGTLVTQGNLNGPVTVDCSPVVSDLLLLDADDYVELWGYRLGGGTVNVISGANSRFSGHLVRST